LIIFKNLQVGVYSLTASVTGELQSQVPVTYEKYSFGCTLGCRLLLMLRNTTDVFRKTMNFDVWQMVDPIKVGVGLSGTIASHKTLTLVVGMTMILTINMYA
jgi:hypothetical protein